jgi:hypothetical protein
MKENDAYMLVLPKDTTTQDIVLVLNSLKMKFEPAKNEILQKFVEDHPDWFMKV